MNEGIKWWENKRIYFNLLILMAGIYGINKGIRHWEHSRNFNFSDIYQIIIFAVKANLYFTLGTLFEILYFSLFKKQLANNLLRIILIIAGTAIASLIAYLQAWYFYVRIELF